MEASLLPKGREGKGVHDATKVCSLGVEDKVHVLLS